MELVEEHYCVRWKGELKAKMRKNLTRKCEFSGFHSNIVSALEDLKTDEAFVDVTLSCDGETIQVGYALGDLVACMHIDFKFNTIIYVL